MESEGVFPRQPASAPGELVDRLMAKIAELESKLYERELGNNSSQLIPAAWPGPSHNNSSGSSRQSAPSGKINRELLGSLGDPEKQQSERKDWLAAVPSWLSRGPLARTALDSFAAQPLDSRNASSTADATAACSTSADGSKGPGMVSPAVVLEAAAADDTWSPAANDSSTRSKHSRPHSLASASIAAAAAAAPEPAAVSLDARIASASITTSSSNNKISSVSNNQQQQSWKSNLKHYYRYYMSSAEVDDETGDLTQRVQEAAGAALAEANERLMEAEKKVQAAMAAQQQLQQQLAASQQLAAEVEALKAENLEAWRVKYDLEGQMAAYKAGIEGMQRQGSCMQKELEDMRKQSQIWADGTSSEVEKLKYENTLFTGQLAERTAELAALRQALTAAEAARDRALEERQQVIEERDKLMADVQQLASLQGQLAASKEAAASATAAAEEWEEKFMRERAFRRKLHEQLQVLRGNIRVMCRVRPALQQLPAHVQAGSSPSRCTATASASSRSCISFPLEGMLSVHDVSTARQREFEFDAVFGPDASQQQVYEEVSPLVRSCADGYNVCIFAYGQTGSGKTHTMTGTADSPGINTQALQELFAIAAEEQEGSAATWSFQVAVLEVYNEAVRDLLELSQACGGSNGTVAAATAAAATVTLDVSGLPAGELPPHMDRVPGLLWRKVATLQEVQAVLRESSKARATAATALNAASSRSHALVTVKVQGVREGKVFRTWLHLVDLAGSERVDKSQVTGQQLKEAQAINKSLSSLGDVIAALQRRGAHIPFRNSKLTQVLQDSLCGSSKVLLVCNLSPEMLSCGETISSLNFASRAAQVELGQARRAPLSSPPPASSAGCPTTSSTTAAEATVVSVCTEEEAAGGGAGTGSCMNAAGSVPAAQPSSTNSALGQGGHGSHGNSRNSSPSPTKISGSDRLLRSSQQAMGQHQQVAAGSTGSSGLGSSSTARASPSRLSERPTSATTGSSTGLGATGSPKIAKPARH